MEIFSGIYENFSRFGAEIPAHIRKTDAEAEMTSAFCRYLI